MEESILSNIDDIYNNKSKKSIIYINGVNGVGKTHFVNKLFMNNLNYNPIWYNSNNNNDIINMLSCKYSPVNSIISYFKQSVIKNIIIIDDFLFRIQIHKILLTTIIQFIKSSTNHIPVIIINNEEINKKINYIKKYSYIYTISTIETNLIKNIIINNIPCICDKNMSKLIKLSDNNLSKLHALMPFYKEIIDYSDIENNNLAIINKLLISNYSLNDYYKIIPESDRTSLSLIYHDNCIKLFPKNIVLYSNILDNFTISDYLDRYIYQKQLWELSEWTNLIKLFNSNYLIKKKPNQVTCNFTKILTKYAIEYSNKNFIIKLCKEFNCKKNKLIYNIKDPPERLLKLYHNS